MYPHIREAAGEPACLKNHPDVRVADIVIDYLAYGWSVEDMCRQRPHLCPAEAHAAMSYYYDHQDDIEREIAEALRRFEESRFAAGSAI
jgi:uncharacterized protein (DUF433 family)